MLLSLHIPKTAGTAWRLYLEANAGTRALFDSIEAPDSGGVLPAARALMEAGKCDQARSLVEKSGAGLIHGHRALDFAPLFDKPGLLAFLREPCERMAAEFIHLRTYRRAESQGFLGVYEGTIGFVEFAARRGNLYSALLQTRAPESARLLAVPIQHTWLAAKVCRGALGWHGQPPRRNVAPRRQKAEAASLLASHRDQLQALLAPDITLYEDWVERWRDGAGLEIAKEVLLRGPRLGRALPLARLRRRLGVLKEQTGRLVGVDWR